VRNLFLGLILTAWIAVAYAATPRQAVFRVENMTCPTCSITIQKALDKVPGVTAKRVDARSATVTVRFDPERTNPVAIAKIITDAGFPATAITSKHGD
jgi:mercuric ion binding protein